jgi:hypothetical protein
LRCGAGHQIELVGVNRGLGGRGDGGVGVCDCSARRVETGQSQETRAREYNLFRISKARSELKEEIAEKFTVRRSGLEDSEGIASLRAQHGKVCMPLRHNNAFVFAIVRSVNGEYDEAPNIKDMSMPKV